MPSWLDELNPAQREAVVFGDGPLLIVAGAGTGKTKTLACRVAHLIERGVEAERILLLTFTRRAASEMIRRAAEVIAEASGSAAGTDPATATAKIWGGTFHGVANRLLRIYGRAVNLGDSFSVMDESDAADLMQLIRNDLGVAKGDRRFPRKHTLVSIYSRTVNAQELLSDVLDLQFPWCKDDQEAIADIFDGYVARKRTQQLLDYDDLLLFWKALCDTGGAGDALADRFEHILVDEYQDTNVVQAGILAGMRKRCKNICVVGDDAQSIYSFRAATIRNILDFPKHFPGARVVTLEENYRSTQPILDASNTVMEPARERYTKNLWSKRASEQKPILVHCSDETHQTEAVCRHILDHFERGVPLMKQAVLFRAGHHSAHLEIELTRRNIPFHKYGGLKFVETAHIKDMLAILRILVNPLDELAWYRILQLLPGVGPRTAQRVLSALGVRGDERPADTANPVTPLRNLIADPPPVPPAARESFEALQRTLANCLGLNTAPRPKQNGRSKPGAAQTAKEPPLSSQIECIREFYEPIFRQTYDNAAVRLRDIEQLAQLAASYRSRARFVADLTLDPPNSTSDLAGPPHLDEDFLVLSTIHSAKGCEWDAVHIIHAADGMIPSDMATRDEAGVDEERRLFYVAMTRARNDLYVYYPLRYYYTKHRRGDAHGYAQLTRFMTPKVCERFERRTYDRGEHWDESDAGHAPTKATDPYKDVSRLWRAG